MHNTAFSFASEVERKIQALSAEDFRLRRGCAKLLLEEWYPISRLALQLKQPGLEIFVDAFGDSGVADGRIEERGFRSRTFDVQVSYVENYEGALRRELMHHQGFTPGAGPIYRIKPSREIVADLVAVDFDHNVRQAAACIAQRFTNKASMSYPENTALLLAFDDVTLGGFAMWRQLLENIHEHATLAESRFISVYIINCATNEIVRAV
jgi:hypothetical protein